jgi:hypothetical protein
MGERPGREGRRSARRLLGTSAEVHIGPTTVTAVVVDVSAHGMALTVPDGVELKKGDVLWILASNIAAYAITATVQRMGGDGAVGVELNEVLSGDALEIIEALPLAPDEVELVDESVSTLDLAGLTGRK